VTGGSRGAPGPQSGTPWAAGLRHVTGAEASAERLQRAASPIGAREARPRCQLSPSTFPRPLAARGRRAGMGGYCAPARGRRVSYRQNQQRLGAALRKVPRRRAIHQAQRLDCHRGARAQRVLLLLGLGQKQRRQRRWRRRRGPDGALVEVMDQNVARGRGLPASSRRDCEQVLAGERVRAAAEVRAASGPRVEARQHVLAVRAQPAPTRRVKHTRPFTQWRLVQWRRKVGVQYTHGARFFEHRRHATQSALHSSPPPRNARLLHVVAPVVPVPAPLLHHRAVVQNQRAARGLCDGVQQRREP
jgi:hypothetical protein